MATNRETRRALAMDGRALKREMERAARQLGHADDTARRDACESSLRFLSGQIDGVYASLQQLVIRADDSSAEDQQFIASLEILVDEAKDLRNNLDHEVTTLNNAERERERREARIPDTRRTSPAPSVTSHLDGSDVRRPSFDLGMTDVHARGISNLDATQRSHDCGTSPTRAVPLASPTRPSSRQSVMSQSVHTAMSQPVEYRPPQQRWYGPDPAYDAKLPKLKLLEFSGDPTKWQPFWDRFQSMVGRSQRLGPAVKLAHLVGLLKGDALNLVSSLPTTDGNYEVACHILRETYGNPNIAIDHIEAKLRELEIPKCDAEHLRRFYCELENYFGSLSGLGYDTTGRHLVSTILQKLPPFLVQNMERDKDPENPWTIPMLRKLLKKEVEVRESSERFCGKPKPKYQDRKPSTSYKPFGTTEALVGQELGKVRSSREHGIKRCLFCGNSNHFSDLCVKYKTIEDRRNKLRNENRCFICTRQNEHISSNCDRVRPCYHCESTQHHRSLCPKKVPKFTYRENASYTQHVPDGRDFEGNRTQGNTEEARGNAAVSNAAFVNSSRIAEVGNLADDEQTIMKTALVEVDETDTGKTTRVRMFLDTGCSRTYVTEDLAKRLKLKMGPPRQIKVSRFGGGSERYCTVKARIADLSFKTIFGKTFTIKVAVTNDFMHSITKMAVNKDAVKQIPCDLQLSDEPFTACTNVAIDFLLGNDYYDDFVTGHRIQISPGLRLISSEFGWLLTGRVADDGNSSRGIIAMCGPQIEQPGLTDTMEIEPAWDDVKIAPMEDLWSLESIGITENPNPASDDTAWENFNRTVKFEDGRYQVTWPWKANACDLPSNYELAKRRLVTTVARIRRTPGLLERYNGVITDQLEKSVIEEAPVETPDRVHYLPHREVLTPDKETTKLRIVYDASARSAPDKPSLNDCLYRGLVFMAALICLLMRFMVCPVVVISDLEKAFLQVGLQAQERDVTRFLWLRDLTAPISPSNIVTYRFTRVPFGMSPSQFLLGATIAHHLRSSILQIARVIEDNLYVDNVITGFGSTTEAIEFYEESKTLFRAAGMNLREFASNSRVFMQNIPEVDRAAKKTMKVLGIGWDIEKDELYLNVPNRFPDATTKRGVMQGLLKVYDPLGFVAPVIVRSRILLQKICSGKTKNWNDRLPQADIDTYWSIVNEYMKLRDLRFPRYVGHRIDRECRLMCFCDASKDAYAAVIYLQREIDDRFSSRIIFAKARVSPLKGSITIPRLELMAVLIGVRAVKFIREYLDFDGRVIVWTDSQCVLKWLSSDQVKGTFIENRLREIRKVPRIEYKFVPTKDNPADLPSRGTGSEDLSDFWWNGPTWSLKKEGNWPDIQVDTKQALTEEHTTKEVCLPVDTVKIEPPFQIDGAKFSSFGKLMRVTALCLRLEKKFRKQKRPNGETREAERLWIKFVQRCEFGDLIKALQTGKPHPLRNQLGVVLDPEGLLRCNGRMESMLGMVDRKAPLLLPSKHWLTMLMVQHYHVVCLHGGKKLTLNTLRRRYWVPRGQQVVAKVLHRCVTCKKATGVGFARPRMPNLPCYRVTREFPFTHTGLDYFGPMYVKQNGEESPVKVWCSLFTCLTTRAMHLELVGSLSAADFLLALRKFVSRRGMPEQILCDNGSQFKAVAKTDLVSKSTHGQAINWQFITALSPWKGGVYERLVGLVKIALKKTIGKALLSKEQLSALLTEVEYTLNSRPLVGLDDDVNLALTPNDLLGVKNLGDAISGNVTSSAKSIQEMFRRTRNVLEEFWKVWREDYLNDLRSSHRMSHKDKRGSVRREPKIGEVVIVKEDKLPRNRWKLAVISALKSGQDNAVRAVEVKFANGTKLIRPLTLIFPLEVQSSDEQEGKQDHVTSQQKQDLKHQQKQSTGAESTAQRSTRTCLPRNAASKARVQMKAQIQQGLV